MKVSRVDLNISVEVKTGSRQDPATGTHKCPLSAIAIGGMVLYCVGVLPPLQCIEKNEMPLLSRPATCPNVLHPISRPSAWIMHDKAFSTSSPTWSTMGFPRTWNIPDRVGLHDKPARFLGQSEGVLAAKHAGT